jgi:hypothetical protein
MNRELFPLWLSALGDIRERIGVFLIHYVASVIAITVIVKLSSSDEWWFALVLPLILLPVLWRALLIYWALLAASFLGTLLRIVRPFGLPNELLDGVAVVLVAVGVGGTLLVQARTRKADRQIDASGRTSIRRRVRKLTWPVRRFVQSVRQRPSR